MEEEERKSNWFSRLKKGLQKSSYKISEGIENIFTKKKLDETSLIEFEELLISADLGVNTAQKLTNSLRKTRFNEDVRKEEIQLFLAQEISKILKPVAKPLKIDSKNKPYLILIVGINGSGKTTTVAKLGNLFKNQKLKVRLAAADTFRAAAVEQLVMWGTRCNIPVEIASQNSDPASLAFEAYNKARQAQDDILIIDTAGRLHNKEDLMAELAKIRRVLQKIDSTAPHECLLVLDATIGQNAHSQVEVFQKIVNITGLVVTKLDSTSKGGVLISLAEKFHLPVYAIGVGEHIEDLRNFEAEAFAESLVGFSKEGL
jgi:fused signal recognition particle receptor